MHAMCPTKIQASWGEDFVLCFVLSYFIFPWNLSPMNWNCLASIFFLQVIPHLIWPHSCHITWWAYSLVSSMYQFCSFIHWTERWCLRSVRWCLLDFEHAGCSNQSIWYGAYKLSLVDVWLQILELFLMYWETFVRTHYHLFWLWFIFAIRCVSKLTENVR